MCFDVFWRCFDFFVFQVRVLGCGRAWLGNRTRDRVLRSHEAYQLGWGAVRACLFFWGGGQFCAWLGNRTRDRVLRRHEAYQLSWGGGARGAFFFWGGGSAVWSRGCGRACRDDSDGWSGRVACCVLECTRKTLRVCSHVLCLQLQASLQSHFSLAAIPCRMHRISSDLRS